jgi:hypothetical protein
MSSAGVAKEPTYPTWDELRHLADQDRHAEISERLKHRTIKVAIATALRRRREATEKLQGTSESGCEQLPALPRDVMRLILLRSDSGTLSSAALASPEFAFLVHCDDFFWRERYERDLPGLSFMWNGELPPGFPEGTRMVPWKAFYNVMHAFHRHLSLGVFRARPELKYEGQEVTFTYLGENRYQKVTMVPCVDKSSCLSDVVISLDRFLRVCYGWTLRSFVKQMVEDTRYAGSLSDSASVFFLIALRAGDITQIFTLPTPLGRPKACYSFVVNVGERGASLSLFDFFRHERPPRFK